MITKVFHIQRRIDVLVDIQKDFIQKLVFKLLLHWCVGGFVHWAGLLGKQIDDNLFNRKHHLIIIHSSDFTACFQECFQHLFGIPIQIKDTVCDDIPICVTDGKIHNDCQIGSCLFVCLLIMELIGCIDHQLIADHIICLIFYGSGKFTIIDKGKLPVCIGFSREEIIGSTHIIEIGDQFIDADSWLDSLVLVFSFVENSIDVCVWQKCQFHLGTFTKWNEVEIDTFVNFDNTVYNKFVKMCRFQVICND